MFTTQQQEPATMFDVPHFIVEALKKAPKEARLLNGTHLLIGAKGPAQQIMPTNWRTMNMGRIWLSQYVKGLKCN